MFYAKFPARIVATLSAAAIGIAISAAPRVGDDWLSDSIPARWSDDNHFSQTMPSEDSWWHNFNDTLLDSLIAEGEKNNFNLQQAWRNIEMARVALQQARSGYFPTLDLQAGWSTSRSSGAISGPSVAASTTSGFSAGISMNWEIDVFGRVAASAKEKKSLYSASRADYASTMVSLCSQIATAYVDLRMYQAQLAVTKRHIDSEEKILAITKAREEAGIASMLDVSQASTVYYSTIATVPALETSIHTTINAINILVGAEPGTFNAILEQPRDLLPYDMIVDAGIPMELLRRRPDVVAAEYQIEADAAALGIAKKEYLPSLSLTGSIGTSAHDARDLAKNNAFTYSIAPTLSWTIFDGMSRKYDVASAREQMMAAIDVYNQTVLTAVEEVDNSMFSYINALKYIDQIDKVVESSQKSLDLSVSLYKRGLSQFYNVVEAQTSVLSYENTLMQAKCQAVLDLINLYKALGGGWTADSLGQ